MTAPRVLIADDHEPTRALMADVLKEEGFEVCGLAADAVSALEGATVERPDLCLLDIDMPGSGLAVARIITDRLPETAVVMLTVSKDGDDLLDALKAGAAGYLIKGADPASYGEDLRSVLRGEAVIPRELTARLVDDYRHNRHRRIDVDGRPVRLSAREWEVLSMLRDGLSTAEIAERTFVAPVTVRSHISSMFKKLQVSSREEAVALLVSAG